MGQEILNYSVSWEGFLVAARLSTKSQMIQTPQGQPRRELVLEAGTVGIVDRYIYQVRDLYRTQVEPDSLVPLEIFIRTLHGKKQAERHYLVEPRKRQLTLGDGTKRGIPPRMFDIPSLFYLFRKIVWKAGKTERYSLLERGNLYEIQCRLEGAELVTVREKLYPALKIAVWIMAEESPDDAYRIRLYLAETPDRTPLLITASPSWGEVRVELESPLPHPPQAY
jgi:hypothetical protein